MPRQQVEEPHVARPAKRRRNSQDNSSEQNPDHNGTPGNSTPVAKGTINRKRIRESDVVSRPNKRARSPLTSSQRGPQLPDPPSPRRSPARSPPRKRPGAGARVDHAARRAIEEQRRQREEAERQIVTARTSDELVSSHYNAVPQRGREWRKTDSQIKGLRSLNNWTKSALIQKFSQPEIPTQNLLVLDIGCGKGGDLQKWQAAPQAPALYVGVDPASVSIDQARSRYEEMKRRPRRGPRGRPLPLYEAHFFVQDCFNRPLGQIPIIQQVGFDPNAGPDANGVVTGRFSRGGFDVISMMFCLHYSFESEEKARGMLKNVSGALKKGGRFLGAMPNSDVISAHVEKHLKGKGPAGKSDTKTEEKSIYDEETWDPEKPSNEEDDWDPEKPSDAATADDDDWDPEKPSEGLTETPNDSTTKPAVGGDDDWDPTATLDSPAAATTPKAKTPAELPPLEWGNSKYSVKFPQTRPLPHDGVFRPPYGWKYFFYLEEAVDVPEYVVPWEGFRALAEDYGLELLYRKPFKDVWEDEKDDPTLGPLSRKMGVVNEGDGRLNVTPEEMEAASFYHAFCFYKI